MFGWLVMFVIRIAKIKLLCHFNKYAERKCVGALRGKERFCDLQKFWSIYGQFELKLLQHQERDPVQNLKSAGAQFTTSEVL